MSLPSLQSAAASLAAAGLLSLLSACGGGATQGNGAGPVILALVAPTTADPYVYQTLRRGADLAVRELNAKGGVEVAGAEHQVTLRTYDDGLDPQRTRSAVQTAIHDGAVGVLTDGYGAATVAGDTARAGVPVIVVNNGDATLMDPASRPSVFRLGIGSDAAAAILSGYVAKGSKAPAVVHDDTDYGRDGGRQMQQSLATAGVKPTMDLEVAAAVPAVDAQVRAVLDAHSDSLVVWGTDVFVGRVVAAARAASATLPVFTGPSGESPAVRAVAGATATQGMAFVSARMTSEDDSASFGQFEHRLAAAEGGPTDAGIKDREGREIRQPADAEIFSYDAVNLLAAALAKSGAAHASPQLVAAMSHVNVHSANGDTRGFNPDNHEGVADDDLYIARVDDMVFAPVKDEELSATLPTEDQLLADFH
jgi:ABC-type branched-subunit amino acid transport system substrate-binding protein